MDKGYTKFLYDDNSGFRLHHTKGQFAASSTTGYLHYDMDLSLIYFINGIGEIKIEGKKYTIEDNDLILLKPSELYHCTVKDGTYHERLVLYFSGALLDNFKESGKSFLDPFYDRPDGFENKIPAEIVRQNNIDVEIKELLELVKDQGEVIDGGVLLEYNGNSDNVIIPNGIIAIGDWVFCQNETVKSVFIPETVTSIGHGCFMGCKNINNINIPESISFIGFAAFKNCETLKKISLPNKTKNIEYEMFCGCTGLANEDGFVIVNNIM